MTDFKETMRDSFKKALSRVLGVSALCFILFSSVKIFIDGRESWRNFVQGVQHSLWAFDDAIPVPISFSIMLAGAVVLTAACLGIDQLNAKKFEWHNHPRSISNVIMVIGLGHLLMLAGVLAAQYEVMVIASLIALAILFMGGLAVNASDSSLYRAGLLDRTPNHGLIAFGYSITLSIMFAFFLPFASDPERWSPLEERALMKQEQVDKNIPAQ